LRAKDDPAALAPVVTVETAPDDLDNGKVARSDAETGSAWPIAYPPRNEDA